MRQNIILNTDSYKTSHYMQYPPGTDYVSSYIEARVGDGSGHQGVVFFGLQMFIEQFLMEPITRRDIRLAKEIIEASGLPFHEEGWNYILDTYNGYLPLSIEALPEGSVVPRGTPLVQVVNTDPNCHWLTSYLETALLRAVWYPTTVATLSRSCKRMIYDFLLRTSDEPDAQIPFKLQDFGARGVSSFESAGIGGAAHLVNFMGTDTLTGTLYAKTYYGEPCAGYSVPASEHSTMTSWGVDGEAAAYRNMLEAFPTGIVSVVSDSYDYRNAVDVIWGEELREEVLARDGVTVIRPDSGDPETEVMFTLDSLWRTFGASENKQGFKVLHPKVRIIQGDGVDEAAIGRILTRMESEGWAADNIVFGMGGGLLQKVNRDTLRFAMKASAIHDASGWRSIGKMPKTDPTKGSKKGFQTVAYDALNDEWEVISSPEPQETHGLLQPVYTMKEGMVEPHATLWAFADVRRRAAL